MRSKVPAARRLSPRLSCSRPTRYSESAGSSACQGAGGRVANSRVVAMVVSASDAPLEAVRAPAVPVVAIVATRKICQSIIALAVRLRAVSRGGQSAGHRGANARQQIAVAHRAVDQLALARLQRSARELNDLRQDQLQIGEQRAHLRVVARG